MNAYAERFGNHLIDTSCAKQSVVALSSEEAEYYALTRGAAAGLVSVQVYKTIGFNQIILCMLTDSTAAKGIAGRSGSGKVKHLSIKELWLQDKVKSGELTIRKEPTATNWADLGTKALNGSRITELLQIMPLTRRGIAVACLLCIIDGANGQPDEGENSSTGTLGSVFMMIVCALIGLIICAQCIIRWLRMKKQKSLEKETQTEPARPVWLPKVTTKDVGTQSLLFCNPCDGW